VGPADFKGDLVEEALPSGHLETSYGLNATAVLARGPPRGIPPVKAGGDKLETLCKAACV